MLFLKKAFVTQFAFRYSARRPFSLVYGLNYKWKLKLVEKWEEKNLVFEPRAIYMTLNVLKHDFQWNFTERLFSTFSLFCRRMETYFLDLFMNHICIKNALYEEPLKRRSSLVQKTTILRSFTMSVTLRMLFLKEFSYGWSSNQKKTFFS